MAFSDNTRGALLMSLAMAGFTFNDALTKTLTDDLNVGQIMFVRGVMMTILVFALARRLGGFAPMRTVMQPMVLARVALECAATILFLSALGLLPLSSVSAVLQSMPLVVTVGAALFLREPVGWHRWTAIIIGFGGMLLIIRPGPEGFQPASVLLLICVCCTAGRDLVTKRIGPTVPSVMVTLLTAIAAIVIGAALIVPLGGWRPLTASAVGVLAIAAVLLVVAHQAIVMAMRTAEVSFVAPFRYTSLIWAVAIGIVFFGETINIPTAFGAVIVICSGLYTFYRENKRKNARPISQSSRPGSPL
ncbi:DMT family transporter [Ciceribacter sp. L1K23]|uniref:DMT family transporter n=1 Tax=Ciceribacter sp. L1K23 TaxID=2820276 RepID=UPI001B81FA57|nr:DMT family transporter [Ciceribacter sp. L1K23]MBR0555236.1 DMT family transporter [Ciceribacter sp. L1K23]